MPPRHSDIKFSQPKTILFTWSHLPPQNQIRHNCFVRQAGPRRARARPLRVPGACKSFRTPLLARPPVPSTPAALLGGWQQPAGAAAPRCTRARAAPPRRPSPSRRDACRGGRRRGAGGRRGDKEPGGQEGVPVCEAGQRHGGAPHPRPRDRAGHGSGRQRRGRHERGARGPGGVASRGVAGGGGPRRRAPPPPGVRPLRAAAPCGGPASACGPGCRAPRSTALTAAGPRKPFSARGSERAAAFARQPPRRRAPPGGRGDGAWQRQRQRQRGGGQQ
jgi:hypothetical protein